MKAPSAEPFSLKYFEFVFSDSNLIIDLSFIVLFFAAGEGSQEQKYDLLSCIFGTISKNSHSTAMGMYFDSRKRDRSKLCCQ